MLKQWFLGRKKNSSTTKTLTAGGHRGQDPNIICSLGERYVVYRTNPIYMDDNHWLETAATKQSPLSLLAPHDPKLHVQTWCSLVCPKHLTTCCACKPAWTYCDNCHPPVKHPSVKVSSSPDLLPPSNHLKESIIAPLTYVQNRLLDLTLAPGDLFVSNQEMNGAHYYHVIDPFHGSDDTQKFSSTAAAATAINSKEGISQSHRYNHHHHHGYHQNNNNNNNNNTKNSKTHRPNSNNKSHQQRHHHHHHHHSHRHHRHYYQSNDHQKRKFNNSITADNDNDMSSGGANTGKKSSPVLHIYINSDFVSEIAVSGSNAVVNGDQQTDSDNYVYPEMTSNEMIVDGQLDISGETDSLESLRIDERIFAPAIVIDDHRSHSHHLENVSSHHDGIHYESDVQQESMYPTIRKHETISPASSRILLTDSEAAYEAVKDLYEKLSNNRYRQIVTQAMSDTQQSKAIRNYVQNTYETLTKHTRLSYAKLVDNEFQRTSSSIYVVPSETTSSVNNEPRFNRKHKDHQHHVRQQQLHQTSTESTSRSSSQANSDNINSSSSDETNFQDKVTPDMTRESSINDQFITRRDPKYGDQLTQTTSTVAESNGDENLLKNLKKRFKQKNYRDACKIIVTTLIGLIAFGIITALSLSVNRQ